MKHGTAGAPRERETRTVVLGVLAVLVAVVVVTVFFVFVARLAGVPFDYLSRDTSAVLDGPFYAGYYANLTIFVWTVPAAVALFTAAVLRRAGRRVPALMLAAAGVITTLMVVDDFFLVHESLGKYFRVSEKIEPVAYAAMIVGFTWYYRKRLRIDVALALAALGCWGVSASLDNVLHMSSDFAVEDGMKLLGVGLWTYMVVRVATRELLALRAPATGRVKPKARPEPAPADPDSVATARAAAVAVPTTATPAARPVAARAATLDPDSVITAPVPVATLEPPASRHSRDLDSLETSAVPAVRPVPRRTADHRRPGGRPPLDSRPGIEPVNGHRVGPGSAGR